MREIEVKLKVDDMLKINLLILIATFLILPASVLAQNGSVPVQTTIVAPAQATSAARTVVPSPTPTPTPTPRPSPPASPSPTSLTVTPIPPTPTILTTDVPAANNGAVGAIIGLVASVSAVGGYLVYKGKTSQKKTGKNRCGNIRELLEQKQKELEGFVRKWPEEKLKSMAKEKVVGELKKDEDVKKIIETAESLKAKHDKLKGIIELLQKKYDLCMLELPSNAHKIRLSYLMGAENIQDKELEDLGIKIVDTTPDGDRMLKVSEKELARYIELIKIKLANGFWNEIIGDKEIIFIFKFKDGSVKEYKLSPGNEQEIDQLCAEFNNEPPDKTANVYKYISDNKFYHDFMVEHYSNMIHR